MTEAKKSQKHRPTVFIGSSAEGLQIAKNIQLLLDYTCEAVIWSQGVFGLGAGTLEALVQKLDSFDFAILVLTPDDLVETRGKVQQAPRDNVLLELGLFIGALGRDRSFAVYDRNANLHLPSDLAGITMANYALHKSGNLKSSLGAATTLIEETIKDLGRRNRNFSPTIDQVNSVSHDNLEALTNQISEMSKILRQLVNSEKSGKEVNNICSVDELDFESFIGVWLNHLNGSFYYPRKIGSSLVVPYCFNGNDRLMAVYYDWTNTGEFLFARFLWFDFPISGFGFFRLISEEQLEGWWWSDDALQLSTEIIPEMPNFSTGNKVSLDLVKSHKVIPKWAFDFHELVAKLGSVHEAIKIQKGKQSF